MGTCVEGDQITPVPGVRITLFPDSTTFYSDVNGDFIIPWSGERTYFTLIPQERNPDGSEWCKRFALLGREPTEADSFYDVGPVTIVPGLRLLAVPWCKWPLGLKAPTLKVHGPTPDAVDTCRAVVSWRTDIWGKVVEVQQLFGNTDNPQVLEAFLDWIRSVRWTVYNETACGRIDPYVSRERVTYAWSDSGWVYIEKERALVGSW